MGRFGMFCLSLVIVLTSKESTWGQGVIKWETNFPATGTTMYTIDVKGSYTLDPDWMITSTSCVHKVWENGKAQITYDIAFNGGAPTKWGQIALDKLASGTTYNVTAEIKVANLKTMKTATLVTAPVSVKAK